MFRMSVEKQAVEHFCVESSLLNTNDGFLLCIITSEDNVKQNLQRNVFFAVTKFFRKHFRRSYLSRTGEVFIS